MGNLNLPGGILCVQIISPAFLKTIRFGNLDRLI